MSLERHTTPVLCSFGSVRESKGIGCKGIPKAFETGPFASQSLHSTWPPIQTEYIKCQGTTIQAGKEEPIEGQILKFTVIIEKNFMLFTGQEV